MIFASLLLIASFAGQGSKAAFAPPLATMHYAPDRTFDLLNVAVDIDVDYDHRGFKGHVINTVSPLRGDLTELGLMAGKNLNITRVTINGIDAQFRRDGEQLSVSTLTPTKKGEKLKIGIDYNAVNTTAEAFGGDGGWHWITPRADNKNHVGFWTQGEPMSNRNWAPTWDYPNDFTTSETRTTVPADWTVVGNGILVSNKLSSDHKRRTFDWRMGLPHATYLLSLVGGPFDIKKDNWEGVDLWYVVPKGEGKYIDDSFAGTKDMLSFYSKIVGVKFAWPKYAQDAMYDFGGGMENVSATTLGEGSLTEKRAGFRLMDSLTSHEMGHQWFGDYVTCKDWGDTWLNEGFATYMQMMYFEHSRGKNGYDREVEDNTRTYLAEARRYERPISTKLYQTPINMFDGTTYSKGGMVLHTLRRWLGDEAFFAGLHLYLTTYAHQPVESCQLRRAMTQASGINCDPFWAQWFDKPGHPVFEYTWKPTAAAGATITVKQIQDTSKGTPIYDMPGKFGFIAADGTVQRYAFHIGKADETFDVPLNIKPVAGVLDPDHDVLRDIPNLPWQDGELLPIFQFAPSCLDRDEAFRRLLKSSPSEDTIRLMVKVFEADNGLIPAFPNLREFGALAKPELRQFWIGQLNHPDFDREAQAVTALGLLPPDAATTQKLRSLVTDQAPIPVVIAAIRVLGKWDLKGNTDVIKKAQTFPSRRDRIKSAANSVLTGTDD
jgi:aminopeptidase N